MKLLQQLYTLFASYCLPSAVRRQTVRQSLPDPAEQAIYSLLTRERAESDKPELPVHSYVFSVNTNFVSDQIKTLPNGKLMLYVAHDEERVLEASTGRTEIEIAVSLATPYAKTTTDQLHEFSVMNDIREQLLTLIHDLTVGRAYRDEDCPECLFFNTKSLRVVPLDPVAFFGLTGWTAYLTAVSSR